MGDLRIKDLVVEYASGQESVRPINGLNLDVSAGSLAILLGPSGCGKTTLLSCLGGILRPSAGRIEFGDIDITKLDASALSDYRRNTVGIVFQAFNLVPSLTAIENVIALDPPLLIADEPTARLDYIQVEEVLRLIRELASGERVVVVATHDTRMLPLADRVVELVPHLSASDHEPQTLTLAAGETLFEQGTMGDSIYVVSSGEVELVRELATGDEEVATTASAGEYFGEMGPLFALPRSATARARTDSTIVSYTVQGFRELMGAGGSRDIIEHKGIRTTGSTSTASTSAASTSAASISPAEPD